MPSKFNQPTDAAKPKTHLCRWRLQAGDPIPGSTYIRAYCYTCGEPIRVAPSDPGALARMPQHLGGSKSYQRARMDFCVDCDPLPKPREQRTIAGDFSA